MILITERKIQAHIEKQTKQKRNDIEYTMNNCEMILKAKWWKGDKICIHIEYTMNNWGMILHTQWIIRKWYCIHND